MNKRPTLQQFIIINLINNIPMALVMSTAAPLLAGQPIVMSSLLINMLLAFIIACIINALVPIPLIAAGFPKLFKLDPQSTAGKIVGNIPVCFIFVAIIGLILTYYNVRIFPIFIFAFLATFIPLYIICFIISMITAPIAFKAAFGREQG